MRCYQACMQAAVVSRPNPTEYVSTHTESPTAMRACGDGAVDKVTSKTLQMSEASPAVSWALRGVLSGQVRSNLEHLECADMVKYGSTVGISSQRTDSKAGMSAPRSCC